MPDTSPQDDAAEARRDRAPAAPAEIGPLLLGFEPLGEDLSFGMVQRAAGLEPLGLLRFAVLHLDPLIRMIDGEFAGLGANDTTQLLLRDQAEYVLRDTRYGMLFHTFKAPGGETPAAAHETGCRLMQFLARRLLEELKAPSRIFLRTSKQGESVERILLLAGALSRFAPAVLLFVEQSDDAARIGRAEFIAPNVLRGAVRRLGWDRPALDEWVALCGSARDLVDAASG